MMVLIGHLPVMLLFQHESIILSSYPPVVTQIVCLLDIARFFVLLLSQSIKRGLYDAANQLVQWPLP